MLMIPEPMWMLSVMASAYAIQASFADRWEYSSRKWCSVTHVRTRAIGRLHDVGLGPQDVLLGLPAARSPGVPTNTRFHGGPSTDAGWTRTRPHRS
jgi:hypothetical protein